ncbi:unnamed protein product, partial [Didymodactylos carnosus]
PYRDLVIEQYNSISAENSMKMTALQPTEGKFDFSSYTIRDVALKFGLKRIHGHTLVWSKSLPKWVVNAENATLPKNTTLAARFDLIMKKHIQTVIKHYNAPTTKYRDAEGNPLMKSWDVCNEVMYDNGSYRGALDIQNGNDKGSIWYRTMGQSYIQNAYVYARQAALQNNDTNLKLFYNDYGQEYSSSKRDAIYTMLMGLKQVMVDGHPVIDGVGLQMHINYDTSNTHIELGLRKMASTGLMVHIAELDISINREGVPLSQTIIDQRAVLQEQKYRDVAMIYRRVVPKEQRWGITLWNVGDKDSWLAKDAKGQQINYPCLYDINYVKKSAFHSFYAGLNVAF